MPRPRSKRTIPVLLLALLAMAAGCGRQADRGPAVARVGSSSLTATDLAALRDSGITEPLHVRAYVDDWVAEELLYQEAARRGIPDDPAFTARVDAVRRRLAVEALLAAAVYGGDSTAVDEDAIRALYASGGSVFLLSEPVASVSFALFTDRDAANTFRTHLLRGAPWADAVRSARTDTLLRTQLLQLVTRQYFSQSTLYPEELWKLARTLQINEVSFAVRTDAGYYILLVHSFRNAGDMPDFEYVRTDLRDRLLIEHRRRRYEQMLADLRRATTVDVRTDILDSIAAHTQEHR